MRPTRGGQTAIRAILAAALVATTAGAATVAAAEGVTVPPLPGAPVDVPALVVPEGVQAPADVVRETGAWFSHGWTLDLRPDGTGTFASWVGAFDGNRISLRLIPAPGEATVAEVVAVETVGQGALAPGALPGRGGLVTVSFGAEVRTAHVEWSSGVERHAVDLCPAQGLDAAAMEALRCGA